MTTRFSPHRIRMGGRTDVPHLAQDYGFHVSDAQSVGVDNAVRLVVDDADNDTAVTYLTLEHAKALARILLEVAEAIEEQANKLEVGDVVETVEQLKALPVGTTIFSYGGRPWYKAGPDEWEGSNVRPFNSGVAMALTPATIGRLGDAN